MSLDVWLKTGKVVNISGRDMRVMPLPLSRLRTAMEVLDERVRDTLKAISVKDSEHPNIMKFVVEVVNSFDSTELAYQLLTLAKDPQTGKPVNDVTKEFLEEFMDVPTLRKLVVTFVEVNEIEDLLKNLQGLPMMRDILEAVRMTYGVQLLKYLQQNTDSDLGRSQNSQSLKSTDTSEQDGTEIPGNGPVKPSQMIQ